jgi:hypothetical protein
MLVGSDWSMLIGLLLLVRPCRSAAVPPHAPWRSIQTDMPREAWCKSSPPLTLSDLYELDKGSEAKKNKGQGPSTRLGAKQVRWHPPFPLHDQQNRKDHGAITSHFLYGGR